jgi:hypothetical protein
VVSQKIKGTSEPSEKIIDYTAGLVKKMTRSTSSSRVVWGAGFCFGSIFSFAEN